MKKQWGFSALRALIEAVEWSLFLFALQIVQLGLFKWKEDNLFQSFYLIFISVFAVRLLWAFCKRFWQFAVGWTVMSAGTVMLAYVLGDPGKAVWSAIACSIMLLLRVAPGLQVCLEPGWIKLGIMTGIFLFITAQGENTAQNLFYSIFVYIILKILYDSLSTTDTLIEDLSSKAFLPHKQIRTVGFGLTLLYLIITAGIMILFSLIPTSGFLATLSAAGKAFLQWLISLFSLGDPPHIGDTGPEINGSEGSIGEGGPMEPSWFAILLEKILLVLAMLALVAVVVAIIAYIVYRFYKHFYEVPQGRTEEREFVLPFMKKESAEKENVRSKKATGRDPVARIRKLYKKKIRSRITGKQKLAPNLTPEEQIAQVRLPEVPEREHFRELYEKARYLEQISEKEVEDMRSLADKL